MKYKLSVYFANLGLEDVKMNCSTVATATGGEFLIGLAFLRAWWRVFGTSSPQAMHILSTKSGKIFFSDMYVLFERQTQ